MRKYVLLAPSARGFVLEHLFGLATILLLRIAEVLMRQVPRASMSSVADRILSGDAAKCLNKQVII